MHFDRLRIFAEVARQGSFTRAAEALFLSQPNVSTQVRLLERELGVPLFKQLGRRIFLTGPGLALQRYAQQIFALAGEAERALQGMLGLEQGTLRVGGSMTPGVYVLPALLGRFKRRHPGLHLQLEIGNSRHIRELLRRGELDVGVVGRRDEPERQLIQEPFLDDELVLVVHPGHAWAGRKRIRTEELQETGLIMREAGSGTRATMEAVLAERGCRPSAAMEIGSIEAIKQAVAAGLGPSILSRWAVRAELARGELRELPIQGTRIRRQFYVLHAAARLPGGVEDAFVRHLLGDAGSGVPG